MKEKIIRGFRKITSLKDKKPTCKISNSTPEQLKNETSDFIEKSFSDSVTECSKSEALMAESQSECFDDFVKRFDNIKVDIAPSIEYESILASPNCDFNRFQDAPVYQWCANPADSLNFNKESNDASTVKISPLHNNCANFSTSDKVDQQSVEGSQQTEYHNHYLLFKDTIKAESNYVSNKTTQIKAFTQLLALDREDYYKPHQTITNSIILDIENWSDQKIASDAYINTSANLKETMFEEVRTNGDLSSLTEHS